MRVEGGGKGASHRTSVGGLIDKEPRARGGRLIDGEVLGDLGEGEGGGDISKIFETIMYV
jgi:hypothetical protein